MNNEIEVLMRGGERIFLKKAVLYGNCHMNSIEICLKHSPNFCKEYSIVKIPLFYEGEGTIAPEILACCDLFVYQDIREKNSFGKEFSSKRLIKMLPENCIKVCIPNLYELGYGFFPQNLVQTAQPKFYNKHNPCFHGDERGLFVHGDKVIAEKIEQNYSLKDLMSFVKSGNAISKEDILDVFEKYRYKIRKREENWDIKIYEYIFDIYKENQVFNDFGHPSNIVLKKISERILDFINIENDLKNFEMIFELEEYEDPIYPCVKEALELNYQKKYIREQSNKKLCEHMDFEEYVKEYYFWCQ